MPYFSYSFFTAACWENQFRPKKKKLQKLLKINSTALITLQDFSNKQFRLFYFTIIYSDCTPHITFFGLITEKKK